MEEKRKYSRRFLLGFVVFVFTIRLLSVNAMAAQQMQKINHSGDTDTVDYCLSAYDVSIGLSELRSLDTEDAIKQILLKTAAPVILIRDNSISMSEWKQLPVEELTIDIGNLQREATEEGYEVYVTAPPITEGVQSTIPFKVYVLDDLPEPQIMTIHFAEENMEDITFTEGDIITLELEKYLPSGREGYQFTGWYLDEACTLPFLIPDQENYQTQQVAESITLYAGWKQNDPVKEPVDKPQNPEPEDKPETEDKPEPEHAAETEVRQEKPAAEKPTAEQSAAAAEEPPAAVEGAVPEEPQSEQYVTDDVQQDRPIRFATNGIWNNDKLAYHKKAEKGGARLMEMIVLSMGSMGVAGMGGSIWSDWNVLLWYQKRKLEKRYGTKHGR